MTDKQISLTVSSCLKCPHLRCPTTSVRWWCKLEGGPDGMHGAPPDHIPAGCPLPDVHNAPNMERQPIRLYYADLAAAGEDMLRRDCPFCANGSLPLRRDDNGHLVTEDRCTGCGQQVVYLDIGSMWCTPADIEQMVDDYSEAVKKADVVHILRYGQTLCLMPGVPRDWPEGHMWSQDIGDVTCEKCTAAYYEESRA